MHIGLRLVTGAMCATALAMLGACGGSTGSGGISTASGSANSNTSSTQVSGASAPDLKGCAGLTQADAAGITGDSSLTSNANTAASAAGACIYSDPGVPLIAGNGVTVQSILAPGVGPQSVQAALTKGSGEISNVQPVSGIGDFAYAANSQNGAIIAFAKGTRLVTILAISKTRSPSDVLSSLESVARRMAG